MNRSEAARLLALVASFNNRSIGEADVVAWHSVLDDVGLPDAEEAVRRHFRASAEWIMPVHIRSLVRDILEERAKAALTTGWAPGQYGVPREGAMPEVSGRIEVYEVPGPLLDLLTQVRTILPEGSREALFPRRVAWEREHQAFLRVRDAEPNPLYRPKMPSEPIRCEGCDEELAPHGFHVSTGQTRCPGTMTGG